MRRAKGEKDEDKVVPTSPRRFNPNELVLLGPNAFSSTKIAASSLGKLFRITLSVFLPFNFNRGKHLK